MIAPVPGHCILVTYICVTHSVEKSIVIYQIIVFLNALRLCEKVLRREYVIFLVMNSAF